MITQKNDENREHRKGHKLEYLYQIEADAALYPLLGACVRAAGKEWSMHILSPRTHMPVFISLRTLLKNPEMFQVSEIEAEPLPWRDDDLVVIDGVYNPEMLRALRERVTGMSHVIVAGADPFTDDYDLISRFIREESQSRGVTAFTGPGKGKSSSAFGMAVAAAGRGGRAAIVQWFKEPKGPKGTWSINEHYFPEQLLDPSVVEFYPTGSGFYNIANLDRVKGPDAFFEHRKKAIEGCELARELILSGKYTAIVLDEFVDTLAEVAGNIPQSLLDIQMVEELLALSLSYPDTELVVTGRRVTPHWSNFIKQSYVIEEIRHPWSQKGKAAVSGLDF